MEKYLILHFPQPKSECDCWNALPEKCRQLCINPLRAFSIYHREGVDLNGDGVITLEETVEKPVLYFPVGDNEETKILMLAGWAVAQHRAEWEMRECEVVIPELQ